MTYDCPQLSRRSREKVTKMYDASGKRSWYFHFQGLDYYESASTVQSDDYHLSRNRDNYLPTCSSSFSLSTFPAPPLFLFHLYRNHSVLMCQRSFLRFSSQRLIIRSTNTRIRYSRRGLILHSNESPPTDYTWISFLTEYSCKF